MKNNKGVAPIVIILIILGFLIAGGGAYYLWLKNTPKLVACTQEAKACPDGSFVGRIGPNCEFAECSAAKTDETADWKTYADKEYGFNFKYPENFGANIWRSLFWPPTTTVVSIGEDPVKKGCPDFPAGAQGVAENKVNINNIDYSFYKESEGAAGSSYNSYCYVTERNQKYYVIYFEIRITNGCYKAGCNDQGCYESGCGPYCGTKYETECRNFDLANDVEKQIETIMSTFKFMQ